MMHDENETLPNDEEEATSYLYSLRGWMELSWPDEAFEGVNETPEEHADKVRRVRDLLTTPLSLEELEAPEVPKEEVCKAGWGFPQQDVGVTEYIFYGADVEDPLVVLQQIRGVLATDPFADGYFSVEGEDGERYRQWLIKGGTIYERSYLFPDFDSEELPSGFSPLSLS
ncbi:MAG: hypothetical protein A2Y73_08590 [Chloroflexi bacterium RBG_13_56_8]|nr:MAG: hypothetical protein A2Y73_08590 [Chloroflexi bacterium RBG_13_56_8]